MRFYVASGLENRELVAPAIAQFVANGHEAAYDWTRHGDVRNEGSQRMRQVSKNEIEAVSGCDLVLVMLPGGKGTHIELGAALATCKNKRIILWSKTGMEFGGGADTCVFYHHQAVEHLCCTYEQLLEYIAGL